MDKIIQGNAQPLTSRIATPTGWKFMRDIQVGDEVLTPNGTVTTVTGVYPKGVRPVYDVELRDGSHAEACNEHLWDTVRYKTSIKWLEKRDENGHRLYVGTGEDGRTFTFVNEIMNTDALKEYVDKGRPIYLPVIKPLAYSKKDLSIDPYVLGAILGDGHIQENGVVKFTCADSEIVNEIIRRGYDVVDDLVHGERKGGIGYRIKGLGSRLKDLGLLGLRSYEKFIPELYLYGDIEQRIDLLRGLMDTDGTISTNSEMEFSSSSETLALNVQSLVRSLGGRVALNIKNNVMYTSPNQPTPKAGRVAYRVQNIRLSDINPFILSRKANRWMNRDDEFSRVVNVTYLRDDEVQCISVADESHMYITDDYIPTHNTSNIVFLKSTDDSMLDTLQKMSGTTHRSYTDSKTITRDKQRIFMQNESKVSYTMTTKEVPVISYNDMAFISPSNSIIFRAGDPPIWNRNETVLPMSWRLFTNTIVHAGHDYSLQTIPTLSSALDFDVRKNQPDFTQMLNKRMEQAIIAVKAKTAYQEAYMYTDYQISQLDPDVYSDEIMAIINAYLRKKNEEVNEDADDFDYNNPDADWIRDIEANKEVEVARIEAEKRQAENDRKKFAQGTLSPGAFVSVAGQANHNMDKDIIAVYVDTIGGFKRDTQNFMVRNNSLYSADGQILYIESVSNSEDLKNLNQAAQDENSKVYSEGKIEQHQSYVVTDAFLKFLATRDRWDFAEGRFEIGMYNKMKQ